MCKKIKVLHICITSFPASYGGIESFVDTLCNEHSKLNVDNIVMSLNPKPRNKSIIIHGYRVIQAKQNLFLASTGFSISAFKIFRQLTKEVDIIHYHYPNPFADILHLLCKPKKKTIVTYHSDIIRQKYLLRFYKPIRNMFLRSVDSIIATSPNYFVTSKILQNFTDKVSIIPIGINPNVLKNIKLERVKYWQSRFSEPFFLFVGAMRYYKGLHIAIHAIAETNIKLVICGTGEQEKKLKKLVENLKLKNVTFVGSITDEDKFALLNICYGFIFPSHLRSEAFGISLLEAAISGKPMISCEIGTGSSFINLNNKTGIVVNPGSHVELREAMTFLLDNPNIAKKFGKNAQIRALDLFNSEKQAISYMKLMHKLLQE